MNLLLMSVLDGIVYGLILFMLSAGLTLIYGMMGILNMAHAAFFMLGAYLAYSIAGTGYFWSGIAAATILVAGIGLLIERYLLRWIHLHGHGQELIFTFGLAFAIEELVKLFFGDFPVNYSIPDYLRFPAFSLFGADFPFYRLLMACIAVAMFAVIFALLRFTRVGLIVRAAERMPIMTAALGHDVALVFSCVFALGAGLAGLAGAVAGAYYPTSPTMAINFGVVVFVVVVVGGLGSVQGSFWASLIIGILSSLVVSIDTTLGNVLVLLGVPQSAASWAFLSVPLSALSGVIPFVLMLGVLVFRPSGLMGERR
jgi:branched-chain amino acid transport system permease protein